MISKRLKIFVTTGSILEFDCLVEIIDNLNKANKYNIAIQTGKGRYLPKNCKYFKFTEDINKHYKWADIVITHTGVGTIMELLNNNKKIITIDNPKAVDNHELVKNFNKEGYLIYLPFKDINNNNSYLEEKIKEVVKKKFKMYKKEKNTIAKEILDYLK
jgi:UDP-N-acetylglucosamine transferase subunit ALG13